MSRTRLHALWPVLLAALLCASLPRPAAAQTRELTWAEKMFDKLEHDFGVVARGSDVTYRFTVTNLYKETVRIANVRSTCGCSAATPTKTTLASRETAHIDVTMDTRKFTRRKDSNLIVTFDAPFPAEVRVPVTVYIRTDVVLTPGAVNFGSVERGQPARQKLDVAYAGRDNWEIRGVETNNPHLTAQVVETQRRDGRVNYDLTVTLDPAAPEGELRDQIVLLTDDAESPRVPVLVEAKVEADITVTPALVSLGTLPAGQTRNFTVVLRGRRPFAVERIECESDSGAFKVRLPKDERVVHVLPLTVVPPDKPGPFREEFTVTISGRAEPLTFKAYGTITVPAGVSGS